MVFDGEELLEFAIKAIRDHVDFISATYQTTSYFGNHHDPSPTLKRLSIDELLFHEPDLTKTPRENEVRLRNIGLEASRRAGCTHHISADTDEFYKPEELQFAKKSLEGYDFSVATMENYFKNPSYLISPSQNHQVTFIHSVNNQYDMNTHSPKIDPTRRLSGKCRYFTKEEMTIHHMSYVRRNIRRKLENSMNGLAYKIDQFVNEFDKYQLGGKIKVAPDFINRRTVYVDNFFGIII